MKPERILNIKTRAEWRNWLLQNFNTRSEIWLVYAKKSTGRERIQYNDAVEEALCFGWIDSTRNRPGEFDKRLTNFIQKTRNNKLIRGFGGIDKYYDLT